MKYIDDLSYSNLVNVIQGEEIKAADVLNTIALELEETRNKIIEVERQLNNFKNRQNSLLRSTNDIVKHIKKELPLVVKRNNYVINITKDDILIEKNVI